MSDIFKFVKSYITAKDVAIHYGFHPNRSNLICCPFHNDKHPSMKVEKRFFCFGCGVQGDAIDFVSNYFGIGFKEAAEKLLTDFGITLMPEPSRKRAKSYSTSMAQYKEKRSELTQITRRLLQYKDMLATRIQALAPNTMDEEWSDAFVEEINASVRVTYLIDGLLFGAKDEGMEFYEFYKEEVEEIVRSMEAGESRNHRKARGK